MLYGYRGIVIPFRLKPSRDIEFCSFHHMIHNTHILNTVVFCFILLVLFLLTWINSNANMDK